MRGSSGRGNRRSNGPSRLWSNVAKKMGKKKVKVARQRAAASRKDNTVKTKAARERFRKEQDSIARGKKGAETRKANKLAAEKAAKKQARAAAKAKASKTKAKAEAKTAKTKAKTATKTATATTRDGDFNFAPGPKPKKVSKSFGFKKPKAKPKLKQSEFNLG